MTRKFGGICTTLLFGVIGCGAPSEMAEMADVPTASGEVAAHRDALTTGIVLSEHGHQETSAAASDGSGYLVAYIERGSSTLPGPLKATRVTGAGAVLDLPGIALPSTAASGVRVAWGGGVYLVVWSNYHGGLYAARVDAAGTVLDATPILLRAGGPGLPYFPSTGLVGWDGESFVVAYGYVSDTWVTRVRTDGTSDGMGSVLAAGDSAAALASGDGMTLVALSHGFKILDSSLDVMITRSYPVPGQYPAGATYDGRHFALQLNDSIYSPTRIDFVPVSPRDGSLGPAVAIAEGMPVFNFVFARGACSDDCRVVPPGSAARGWCHSRCGYLEGWQHDYSSASWEARWLTQGAEPRRASSLPQQDYAAIASNGYNFLLTYWGEFRLEAVLIRPWE